MCPMFDIYGGIVLTLLSKHNYQTYLLVVHKL